MSERNTKSVLQTSKAVSNILKKKYFNLDRMNYIHPTIFNILVFLITGNKSKKKKARIKEF